MRQPTPPASTNDRRYLLLRSHRSQFHRVGVGAAPRRSPCGTAGPPDLHRPFPGSGPGLAAEEAVMEHHRGAVGLRRPAASHLRPGRVENATWWNLRARRGGAAGRRLRTHPLRPRCLFRRDDSIDFPFLLPDDPIPTSPFIADPHRFDGTKGQEQATLVAPHAEANSSLEVPSLLRVISGFQTRSNPPKRAPRGRAADSPLEVLPRTPSPRRPRSNTK